MKIITTYGEFEAKNIHKDNGCIFFFNDGIETIIDFEDIISIN